MSTKVSDEEKAKSVFLALNARNFKIAEHYLADEIKLDFPGAGLIDGKRKVVIFLTALLRKYPSLTFTFTDTIIEANKVCIVWTNKGKHVEGNDYNNSGMTLFYFENDQIAFMSDYFKDTSFVK